MDERRAERNTAVTKLVLDVLKPHQPTLIEFARSLTSTRGVERVNASVMEVDAETETIKLIIEGRDLDVEEISETVRRLGGVVHSVDEVIVEVRRVERRG
ncbi:MAG: DUF211 domain-containing protein [Thaumarchaeota archaeon]|nr:DUF211 domain-containing protein [Candidatus Calditenuaceae archaeon]